MPAIRELRAALLLLSLVLPACDSGGGSDDEPKPPRPPPPEDTILDPHSDAPGVRVTIESLSGASGADGSFQSGDHVRVRFRLEKSDGGPWGIAEMVRSSALVSGPSFNYQRVVSEQT